MNFKRIFVAVPVSPALQEKVEIWRAKYERLPVRWLAGKNLHITLIPPWYAADVSNIASQLELVAGESKCFEIFFRRVVFGPEPHRPRLIWAEGETPPELISLKSKLEKILDKEPERRPFRLHLTLARFRPETFSSFPLKRLGENVSWVEMVDSFVLMEAHLSAAGADYEILAKYKLLPPVAAAVSYDSKPGYEAR